MRALDPNMFHIKSGDSIQQIQFSPDGFLNELFPDFRGHWSITQKKGRCISLPSYRFVVFFEVQFLVQNKAGDWIEYRSGTYDVIYRHNGTCESATHHRTALNGRSDLPLRSPDFLGVPWDWRGIEDVEC